MALTVVDHPLAQDILVRLRDRATGPAEFRTLTRRLGTILVVEATRHLPTTLVEVDTPMEATKGLAVTGGLVAVPVLRAGLGLLDGLLDLFPQTVVGYVGLERDDETLVARGYYEKLPPMEGRHALVLDPMLATGGSGSATCSAVEAAGPHSIRFVCVVAAPEGVARMQAEHPSVPIFTAALDRELNGKGYILPGLGDFGDRLYVTE